MSPTLSIRGGVILENTRFRGVYKVCCPWVRWLHASDNSCSNKTFDHIDLILWGWRLPSRSRVCKPLFSFGHFGPKIILERDYYRLAYEYSVSQILSYVIIYA